MVKGLVATASIEINASSGEIWEALITPRIIKEYFFGSDIVTDWQVGGPIYYRGTWQGKAFEDKGTVVEVRPPSSLVVTHWSPLSGTADSPENYHTVSYTLEPGTSGTIVSISQDNNATAEEVSHSTQNWEMVLKGLKRVVEERRTQDLKPAR
jgi:uncharacterized protein YndB with AHSA1/START domain